MGWEGWLWIFRLDREKKVAGGVCIYTRVSLETKGVERSNVCHVWIPATVATSTTQKLEVCFIVCAAFRPPDCLVDYFEGEFINTYTKALTLGMEIFVLGDLNCDLLKICREGNSLKDLCDTLNLTKLVTSATRVTPQSSHSDFEKPDLESNKVINIAFGKQLITKTNDKKRYVGFNLTR